jgi:hypothetical protein
MSRTSSLIILLGLFASAIDAQDVFWLPADEGKQLIPQAAAEKFVSEPSGAPEEEFTGYDQGVAPRVPPRKDKLTFYPCSQCHEHWKTDPTPRALAPVHDVGLQHGQGRLWCLVCHDPDNRDQLHSLRKGAVDFDESWRICGQCHSNRQKDWYFGAHGKRVYSWQGEPERYNCTHCHNPHRPPFIQRKPQPKPPVRAGLKPIPRHEHERPTIWEKKLAQTPASEDSHDE